MKPPIYCETWSDEVKRVYWHDMEEMWDRSLSPHIFNSYQRQLAMYESLVPSDAKSILDVGCAQATLALRLAEKGYDVTAVDIRRDFIDYARTRWTHGNIAFVEANALNFSDDKTFDVIFANQILEHLIYPLEFVKRLTESLKNGGVFVATTPNFGYVRNKLPCFSSLGDVRAWEHLQFTADGDGHFFAYTRDELKTILTSAGLTDVSVSSYETPLMSGHLKFRHLHRILSSALLVRAEEWVRWLSGSDRLCYQLLATGCKKSAHQQASVLAR